MKSSTDYSVFNCYRIYTVGSAACERCGRGRWDVTRIWIYLLFSSNVWRNCLNFLHSFLSLLRYWALSRQRINFKFYWPFMGLFYLSLNSSFSWSKNSASISKNCSFRDFFNFWHTGSSGSRCRCLMIIFLSLFSNTWYYLTLLQSIWITPPPKYLLSRT